MMTTFNTKKACLKDLNKNYTNPEHPISFSSTDKIRRFYKFQLSVPEVKQFLSKVYSYTYHKPTKRRKVYNPYFCYYPRHCFSADLIDISNVADLNGNFHFLLTVIDNFSKFGFAQLLYSKKAKEVLNKFKIIVQQAGQPPEYLVTGNHISAPDYDNFTFL